MTIWKLFDGDIPYVSTAEFHRNRERAPHLEQEPHRPRLFKAVEFIIEALGRRGGANPSVSDLGCGDGGLLSLLCLAVGNDSRIKAWGYDFQPSNAAGWEERGIHAEQLDVFGVDRERVRLGRISVTTEVLEHLADPAEAVRWIGGQSEYIVASSPWDEHPGSHDACHAWAFDHDGYRELIQQGGYDVLRHEIVGRFQVVLGAHRDLQESDA